MVVAAAVVQKDVDRAEADGGLVHHMVVEPRYAEDIREAVEHLDVGHLEAARNPGVVGAGAVEQGKNLELHHLVEHLESHLPPEYKSCKKSKMLKNPEYFFGRFFSATKENHKDKDIQKMLIC